MIRFEFDNEGYVSCILYGCTTGSCVEYNGLVPSAPEAYEDMDDWANNAQIQAYYLDSNGNLAYDPAKAASLPDENDIAPFTDEQLEAMGIISAIERTIKSTVYDAIYPVGSIYMSLNAVNPSILFGGVWERIEDKFLLSAGSTYTAGSEGGSASYDLNVEAHKHTIDTEDNVKFVPEAVTSGSYDIPITGTSKTAGAINKNIPTLPPYLAVYVWQRTS